jgi:hypothetical protein
MEATLEISMYPLQKQYKEDIKSFIRALQSREEVNVVPNGISTHVFGPYAAIMSIMQSEIKAELEKKHGLVFVMKLTSGRHDEKPEL